MATNKLTSAQIEEICNRYQAGESSIVLGLAYSVRSSNVRQLLEHRHIPRRANHPNVPFEKEITMPIEYIAGLFDGEGTIGMYWRKSRGRHCWEYHCRVTGCFKPTLQRLRNQLGGCITVSTHATRKAKLVWDWGLYGKEAIIEFLQTLRPFLIEKAAQADLMLLACKGADKQELPAIALQIKKLKRVEFK